MIKIAVAGAKGRMGQQVVDLVQNDPALILAASLSRNHSIEKMGQTAFAQSPDVLIDFSNKEALPTHLKYCQSHAIPMVIGVTGLTEQIQAEIKQAAKTLPILLSPNMSIGVNLIFKLLAMSSKMLADKNQPSDIAITEIHHKQKKDAPSGTAKRMAQVISEQYKNNKEIQMSSLRIGEVMGDHRVLFALEGEQLEISHKADNRVIFAKGAILAAKWLHDQSPGLYDMQDVLSLC